MTTPSRYTPDNCGRYAIYRYETGQTTRLRSQLSTVALDALDAEIGDEVVFQRADDGAMVVTAEAEADPDADLTYGVWKGNRQNDTLRRRCQLSGRLFDALDAESGDYLVLRRDGDRIIAEVDRDE